MTDSNNSEQELKQELADYKQHLEEAKREIQRLKNALADSGKEKKSTLAQEKFSSRQMKALIANLQMGILVEGADRRVIEANQWFCSLFGIPSPEDLKGINCDDAAAAAAHHFVKPGEFLETIQKRLREGKIVSNEELQLKDGRVFKRDYVPVFDEGVFVGNMWLYRDITERKNNEAKLKENAEQLRELNATKDKFFTIIAHDLRNPFTSILGFSQLIIEHIEEKDYESLEEFSKIIYDAALQAMNLLQNLLTWARSQTGRIEFKPSDIELSSLIRHNTNLNKEDLKNKNISIKTDLPESLHVIADEDMLNTIFRNLISNAIKFSYEGGEIILKVKENNGNVKIDVSDKGMGMSSENVNRLFKLEESLTTQGTNKEKGTGLGLLLCKEFTEYHNGSIDVTSEKGQGTTFHITLPKKP